MSNYTSGTVRARRLATLIAYFGFFLACTGCSGDSSQERYDRLDLNMSLADVEAIMGSAGVVQEFDGQPDHETTYRWDASDSDYYIYVTFRDGQVGSLVEYNR